MNTRQMLELREHEILSPYAAFSDRSRGRDYDEEQCDIRTIYQRDRDRILHSKAFRRLKHKTKFSLRRRVTIIEQDLHIRLRCHR